MRFEASGAAPGRPGTTSSAVVRGGPPGQLTAHRAEDTLIGAEERHRRDDAMARARPPPGYAGACGASGFGLNCPSKASIFSVPQPFGSSQKVR
jgi:hypothetical protein